MDPHDRILDFVKAVSHPDRLRVIGVLTAGPLSAHDVAARLGLPFRQAFNHLGLLAFTGLVHQDGDVYRIDEQALEQLSRQQFARQQPAYSLPPALDEPARKTLAGYLNRDGTLKDIPAQPARRRLMLAYLVAAFEPGRDYTEKEVNAVLRRFHPDTASLRRYLVDAGLLAREADGSRYWRPA